MTERTTTTRWRSAAGTGVILAIALVWRLIGITSTEVWRDEAITLIHARAAWRDLLWKLLWVEDTPPLNFLLFKAWSLAVPSEVACRVLAVLFGVLAVAVMMLIARRLQAGAWWSVGLLAALAPISIHYSQEIRVYSLLMLVTTLCFWQAERVIAGACDRWSVALLSLLAGLAAHGHAVGFFVYPMVGVYILCRGGRQAVRGLVSWPGVALWLLLVSPIVWFSLHWGRLHRELGDWWIDPVNLPFAQWYAGRFVGLGLVADWEAVDRLGRAWGAFALVRLVIVAVVVLLLAGLSDPRVRRTILALVASAVTFVMLLLLTSAAGLPNLVERTLIPAHVPCLLALGIGAAAGANRAVRAAGKLAVMSLALLLAAGWIWAAEWGPPRRDQSLAVTEWLRDRAKPGDCIVSTPDWFEDLAVYRLGHSLPGEAFLTQANPVYCGSPPVHQMAPRLPDPLWRNRLNAAMAAQPDSTIWLLRYSWFTRYRGAGVADIERALREAAYRPGETFSLPGERAASVTGYRR